MVFKGIWLLAECLWSPPLAPASGPPGPGSPSLHSVRVWARDTHMPLMLTGRRRERESWGRGRPCHAGLGPSQETPFWLGCPGGREGKSDSPRTPGFPDLSHLAAASLKRREGCQQKVNRNLFLESETPGWRTQGQKSENGELRAMHAPLPSPASLLGSALCSQEKQCLRARAPKVPSVSSVGSKEMSLPGDAAHCHSANGQRWTWWEPRVIWGSDLQVGEGTAHQTSTRP